MCKQQHHGRASCSKFQFVIQVPNFIFHTNYTSKPCTATHTLLCELEHLTMNRLSPGSPASTCRIQFDDLHHTGLYTWELLYNLGQHKVNAILRGRFLFIFYTSV
jgi:hypothetical protein